MKTNTNDVQNLTTKTGIEFMRDCFFFRISYYCWCFGTYQWNYNRPLNYLKKRGGFREM